MKAMQIDAAMAFTDVRKVNSGGHTAFTMPGHNPSYKWLFTSHGAAFVATEGFYSTVLGLSVVVNGEIRNPADFFPYLNKGVGGNLVDVPEALAKACSNLFGFKEEVQA